MKPKLKPQWESLLTAETEAELKETGRLLSEARKRRQMSLTELAARIGVDRRTLAHLERGNPTVSWGIFFQTLNALNLLRGIEEVLKPENDIESISTALRRARSRRMPAIKIGDEKVNF